MRSFTLVFAVLMVSGVVLTPPADGSETLPGKLFGDGCGARPFHPSLRNARLPRPPIEILGDGGFTPANGVVAGVGTSADPFVIGGWDVRPLPGTPALAPSAGILLEGTTAHVRIEHVTMRPHLALPETARAHGRGDVADEARQVQADVPEALAPALPRGIELRDARNVEVRSVEIVGAGTGIALSGEVGVAVRCSAIRGGLDAGIATGGLAVRGSVLVEGSTIADNAGPGIDLTGGGALSSALLRNEVEANGGPGIRVVGALSDGALLKVEANRLRENGGDGVAIETVPLAPLALEVVGNDLLGNRGAGLAIRGALRDGGSARVEENAANDNGGSGIEISGDVLGIVDLYVRANPANRNGGAGIRVSGAIREGGTLTVAGTDAADNAGSGIVVAADLTRATLLVSGNGAERNGAGGIELRGSLQDSTVLLDGNFASENAGVGIGLANARIAASSLEVRYGYVRANGAGGAGAAGIALEGVADSRTALRVAWNVVEENAGPGLRIAGLSPLVDRNDFAGNPIGVLVTRGAGALAEPVVTVNNFEGNWPWGLQNEQDSVVRAEGNWWRSPSGPGGAGPGGGDAVSAGVDFEPWRTERYGSHS